MYKKLIVESMNNGATLNQLSKITNLSELELGNIIKNLCDDGFCIERSYNSDGVIQYNLNNDFSNKGIFIDAVSDEVRAIVISDLHIGFNPTKEGLIYMEYIYDYAVKNNIHIIFVLGDLFHGVNNHVDDKYAAIKEQINNFFEKYPYSSNILNFILLGNHEYSMVTECGFDLARIIEKRVDVINLGYGIGKVMISEELIGFKHDLVVTKIQDNLSDCRINFKGHTHKCEIYPNSVIVPALLTEPFYNDLLSTGFLDVSFYLKKRYIEQVRLKHMGFLPKIQLINDIYLSKLPPKIKKKI